MLEAERHVLIQMGRKGTLVARAGMFAVVVRESTLVPLSCRALTTSPRRGTKGQLFIYLL